MGNYSIEQGRGISLLQTRNFYGPRAYLTKDNLHRPRNGVNGDRRAVRAFGLAAEEA